MLRDIWIVMLFLGFICLFISLLLFFIWKIPDLVDDLSGRKAKRQIQVMKNVNSGAAPIEGYIHNNIYSSMSDASLLSKDSGNIGSFNQVVGSHSTEDELGTDEISTSDLSDEKGTSYLADDMATSYIDYNNDGVIQIKILEEFSSL